MSSDVDAALSRLLRGEWPRLVAAGVRILGDFQAAEDIVQETLLAALDHWPLSGIPDQPGGDVTGLGATYRQLLSGPGGRKIAGDYRVTTFDRPKTLGFEVIAGPLRPTGVFEVTPGPSGETEVTFRLAAVPRGIMRLMTPMIARQMRTETSSLEVLKTRLENVT
jgi:hypothetical protein